MRKEIDKRDVIISLVYFIICAIGLAVFIRIVEEYKEPVWYYHPLSEEEMAIPNAVSRLANFLYFTYLSLCMFCVWGVLRFFAVALRSRRWISALSNPYLLIFLTVNQFITLVAYTCAQFFSAFPFGFVDFASIWSFLKGIYMHFILTTASLLYFFKFQKNSRIKFKKSLWLLIFPITYGIAVKLIGLYAFKVEWYPYAIFSGEAIWLAVFDTLEGFNTEVAVIMIALVAIALTSAYIGVIKFLCFCANRKLAHKAVNAAKYCNNQKL